MNKVNMKAALVAAEGALVKASEKLSWVKLGLASIIRDCDDPATVERLKELLAQAGG